MLARAAFAMDRDWSGRAHWARVCPATAASDASVQVKCSPSPSPSPSWVLIIHTAGDRHLTRSAPPSRRLGRVTACVLRCYAGNVTSSRTLKEPQRCAAARPASSLSEHRAPSLASTPAQEEAMPSCAVTRPQPAFIRHHHCRCSVAGPHCIRTRLSQPSFVCHHPWDAVMIQAEPIALAGLVNSLHARRSVPWSLRYHSNDGSCEDCEIPYAFITACCTGQGGLTRDDEDTSLPTLATLTRPFTLPALQQAYCKCSFNCRNRLGSLAMCSHSSC